MPKLKSIREILEELAAGDDRLRESFTNWLAEHDRRKLPPKKAPASERPADSQNQRKSR